MTTQIYLISYDISSDKLRTKVANQLLYYGMERIQLSVFLGSMRPTLFQQASQWLNSHITGKDKLIILPLPPQIGQNTLTFGDYSINWQQVAQLVNTLYID